VAVSGIVAQVSGPVDGRPQDVYDFFREVDVTRILTGRGPLPAVVSVDDPSCPWDAPSQVRSLELADGNSLRERLTALNPPHSFSYDIDRITGPLGKLVQGMSGRWSFEPVEEGGSEGPTNWVRRRSASGRAWGPRSRPLRPARTTSGQTFPAPAFPTAR